MYKVMLADDNPFILAELAEAFDWEALSMTVVARCRNGREAMREAQAHPPDIVVTDIVMPFMTGLELAKWFRAEMPEVSVILFSSYDEFEYARDAMKLGVKHYLLKPVNPDQMRAALSAVVEELEQRLLRELARDQMLRRVDAMLPAVRREALREVLLAGVADEERAEGILELPRGARLWALSLRLRPDAPLPEEPDARRWLFFKMEYLLRRTEPEMLVLSLQLNEREWALLAAKDADESFGLSLASELLIKAERVLGAPVFAGVSRGVLALGEMTARRGAAQALSLRAAEAAECAVLTEADECAETDEGGAPESADAADNIAAQVKALIREQCLEPLSAKAIAQRLHYSAGYVNRRFLEATGVTVFEYLQDYRFELAKRLLAEETLRVADVAERVGYVSMSHFCLAFKKRCGLPPAEYRRRLTEGNGV